LTVYGKTKISTKSPYKVKVEKGKIYSWCTCGPSNKQPFYDDVHKTERKFKSLKYIADENKDTYFCGCKLSQNPPFCDGSHSKL
jgi:CDGSH-type Zn-finger protein